MKRGVLFLSVSLIVLFSIASTIDAQTCDYEPKCIPNAAPCGCGGMHTRYTLCDGGCSAWYPCSVIDTEQFCADSSDDDCDGLTDCADSDCAAVASCIDSDSDGFRSDVDCADSDPSVHPGAEELCNLKDDDCDGTIDEGCSCTPAGSAKPCGTDIGACTSGTQTCSPAGEWGACTGILPVSETCDGLDNDCDGRTDEGCDCVDGTTRVCGTGLGVCVQGTETCSGGHWGLCIGNINPSEELCGNSLDDDCNGVVDESCPGSAPAPAPSPALPLPIPGAEEPAPPAEPLPAELPVAVRECIDNDGDGYGLYCAKDFDCDDNDASVNPGAQEVCNNVDDDCDTMVDDQLTKPCGTSDIGACAMGTEQCRAGEWVSCTAVLPKEEVCGNGIDDDCDRLTDEDCNIPEELDEDELALRQFLDIHKGRGDYDFSLELARYHETKRAMNFRKSATVQDGKTTIMIEILPIMDMRDLTIYEYVPKSIAASANGIIFSVEPEVIQSDPLFAWHFSELSEKTTVTYEVVGEFEDAAEQTQTVPIAESSEPIVRPWYFDLIPLLLIPVMGFVFVFLVEIAHKKRR